MITLLSAKDGAAWVPWQCRAVKDVQLTLRYSCKTIFSFFYKKKKKTSPADLIIFLLNVKWIAVVREV